MSFKPTYLSALIAGVWTGITGTVAFNHAVLTYFGVQNNPMISVLFGMITFIIPLYIAVFDTENFPFSFGRTDPGPSLKRFGVWLLGFLPVATLGAFVMHILGLLN